MDVAAFVLSLVAFFVTAVSAYATHQRGRQANALPVLITLFQTYQTDEMASARRYVFRELEHQDSEAGFDGLPEAGKGVRRLVWLYDQLGVLVTHGVVDLDPVAGYLGSSVLNSWPKLKPFIDAERQLRLRDGAIDGFRYQAYHENLVELMKYELRPEEARRRQLLWRLGDPTPSRIPPDAS